MDAGEGPASHSGAPVVRARRTLCATNFPNANHPRESRAPHAELSFPRTASVGSVNETDLPFFSFSRCPMPKPSSEPPLTGSSSFDDRLALPRRRYWKTGLVVAGAVLLLLPILAVLKTAMQSRSLIGRAVVDESVMADGSLLVLEQVTTEKPHEFKYDLPGAGAFSQWLAGKPANPNETHAFSHWSSDGGLVLWMTRWDPVTLRPMDLDWWQVSVLVDENGEEIDDTDPHRYLWVVTSYPSYETSLQEPTPD
jgi:hypothetical protein